MQNKAQDDAIPTAEERIAIHKAIDSAFRAARESGKSGIAATVLKAGEIMSSGGIKSTFSAIAPSMPRWWLLPGLQRR